MLTFIYPGLQNHPVSPPLTTSFSLTIYSSLSVNVYCFFLPNLSPTWVCTRKLVNGLIETRSLNVSELQFNSVVKNRILCERLGSAVFYIWQEQSHNIFLLCCRHFQKTAMMLIKEKLFPFYCSNSRKNEDEG